MPCSLSTECKQHPNFAAWCEFQDNQEPISQHVNPDCRSCWDSNAAAGTYSTTYKAGSNSIECQQQRPYLATVGSSSSSSSSSNSSNKHSSSTSQVCKPVLDWLRRWSSNVYFGELLIRCELRQEVDVCHFAILTHKVPPDGCVNTRLPQTSRWSCLFSLVKSYCGF